MEALGLVLQFAAPFGLMRVGAGLDAASRGLKGRRRAELLRTLPWPPQTGALPPLVKVSGIVEDVGAFESPVTGARCVALEYSLLPGPSLPGRAALFGTIGAALYLRSAQGRIRVELADAHLPLSPSFAAGPERLRRLATEREGAYGDEDAFLALRQMLTRVSSRAERHPDGGDAFCYSEDALAPGEELTLIGAPRYSLDPDASGSRHQSPYVLCLGGPPTSPFERLPYLIRSSWEKVAESWEREGADTCRRGARAIIVGVGLALAAALGGVLLS